MFHIVDGRNPAPPDMVLKPVVNNGIFTISTAAGFLPSTVVNKMGCHQTIGTSWKGLFLEVGLLLQAASIFMISK